MTRIQTNGTRSSTISTQFPAADPNALLSTERIDRRLVREPMSTPFIIIDLDIVRERYRALSALFPYATIFYAVKASPAVPIITALA